MRRWGGAVLEIGEVKGETTEVGAGVMVERRRQCMMRRDLRAMGQEEVRVAR